MGKNTGKDNKTDITSEKSQNETKTGKGKHLEPAEKESGKQTSDKHQKEAISNVKDPVSDGNVKCDSDTVVNKNQINKNPNQLDKIVNKDKNVRDLDKKGIKTDKSGFKSDKHTSQKCADRKSGSPNEMDVHKQAHKVDKTSPDVLKKAEGKKKDTGYGSKSQKPENLKTLETLPNTSLSAKKEADKSQSKADNVPPKTKTQPSQFSKSDKIETKIVQSAKKEETVFKSDKHTNTQKCADRKSGSPNEKDVHKQAHKVSKTSPDVLKKAEGKKKNMGDASKSQRPADLKTSETLPITSVSAKKEADKSQNKADIVPPETKTQPSQFSKSDKIETKIVQSAKKEEIRAKEKSETPSKTKTETKN